MSEEEDRLKAIEGQEGELSEGELEAVAGGLYSPPRRTSKVKARSEKGIADPESSYVSESTLED